ncbi:galactosyltransferase-related protein [Pseudomonas sp. RC10]|uniref:glycosyltransferase family 2 protein n=1 Tax=Pseudomonas bambusae TaxID=3139142 RepID=UPI00313914CA
MNVITLVHGRGTHLANLIEGLESSSLVPDGLWIVHMNEPPGAFNSHRFPIHTLQVNEPGGLPLAKARNSVMAIDPAASWVFLDVDCIPAHDLVAEYQDGLERAPDALHMGQVRYLPEGANRSGWDEATLYARGVEHPLAQFREGPGSALPYHLFWSLNFACHGSTFGRIGGFDAGYTGYGGEDTDFAFRARQEGVALLDNPATAFHQYHPTYDPPLNHFKDIVANARRFYSCWGVWPMEGWLRAFQDQGLLRWDDERVEIIQMPSAEQVAQALNPKRLGF